MVSRKRGREEMETTAPEPISAPSMLDKLRNMWEFANLMQYIYIFGKAVKIDEDLDIEDLEQECLKPEHSHVLSDIGLALLKFVSSHRGLTPDIFDEYTRRQYLAKAPQRNPFGEEEEPKKFTEFDVFTKIKVLVQLSQWTLINADRIKERMEETKEHEQTLWRIEEIGYDREERLYFALDDDRLYRRTDPALPSPPPAPKAKPKSNSKKGKAASRASKRRRTNEPEVEESANITDAEAGAEAERKALEDDGGFGGRNWECLAITLEQYREFLASIQKSRHPDEKALHKRITDDILPIIEKKAESQLRKQQKRERELLNMQKLATAKRSSRLEAKHEREQQEKEAAETEQKKREDLAAAKRDQEKQKKMEEARESRMMTREQRLKEREFKRVLHEEELLNLAEENKKIEAGESQRSERHLKAEMEKKMKDLAALQEEDEWVFDCAKCGVHGNNIDDGSHSVACEKCNVWQHSACLNITQEEAEKDDFHFVCHDCKRREEDAKKPKIPSLKFHIGPSSSPPTPNQPKVVKHSTNGVKRKSGDGADGLPPTKKFKPVEYTGHLGMNATRPSTQNGMHATVMNRPQLSPQGQLKPEMPPNLYAGNASPPPNHTSFAKAPGYAAPRGSTVKKSKPKTDSATHSQSRHKPSPHSSDVPYNPQSHQFYNYKPPHNDHSPPSTYQSYQNGGYSTQAPQGNYHHYPNGYPPHYGGQQAFQGPYQGPYQGTYPQQNTGWSAQYAPPHVSPPQQQSPHALSPPSQQQPYRPPPASQNPFVNSFDRQQHAQSAQSPNKPNTPNMLSSFKNDIALSPAQQPAGAPGPQQPSLMPQINGHTNPTPHINAALPPNGPAGQSPTKHPSPPTLHHSSHVPASSPMANQPPLQPTNAPSSPGFSPQKHSPPPQHHAPHSATATPAVLPPAPKLSPSPVQKTSEAPLKVGPIEHAPVPAPRLSPSPTPQNLPTPLKHDLTMPAQLNGQGGDKQH